MRVAEGIEVERAESGKSWHFETTSEPLCCVGGVIARDRSGSLRLELAAYPCEVGQCGVALADQLRERRADRFLGRTGDRPRGRRAFLLGPRRAWAFPRISSASFSAALMMACMRAMNVPTTSGLSARGGGPSGRGRERAPGMPGGAGTAWLWAESRPLRKAW